MSTRRVGDDAVDTFVLFPFSLEVTNCDADMVFMDGCFAWLCVMEERMERNINHISSFLRAHG